MGPFTDRSKHYMINNIVYDQTKNLNITQDRDLSCNNLCLNGTSALDCSKPVLTIDQLQKWIGINWILFVICVGGVSRGYIGFVFLILKELNL